MRAAVIGLMLALCGCATAPQVRAPLAIEVVKPVAVRCVETAPAR